MAFRSRFRLGKRNFGQHFVSGSEISCDILFGRAKFRATFRLAERNFVQHFIWRGGIRRNKFERAKKLRKTTLGSFAQARALIKLVTNTRGNLGFQAG